MNLSSGLAFQVRCQRTKVLLLEQHRRPIVDSLFIIQKVELCGMYGNAARSQGSQRALNEIKPLLNRAYVL